MILNTVLPENSSYDNLFGIEGFSIWYIVIGIGAILVIALIFILLQIFVFSKRKIRKEFNSLNKEYEYHYSLLINQDTQYMQKLDYISRTNLLYADIYSNYLDRYLELKDNFDPEIASFITELSVLVEDKNVKEFKKSYKEGIGHFNEFCKEVKELDKDLFSVIQPEEDCQRASLLLKDKYREVKSKYEDSMNDLEDVNDKFTILFKNIEKKFNQYENAVETGNFDEANEMLPVLGKVLSETNDILDCLPTYLKETNDIIPKKEGRLLEKSKALELNEVPLEHLEIMKHINEIKDTLVSLREGYKKLNIKGIEEKIKEMHAILDELDAMMDAEEKAKNEFKDISKDILTEYETLEKNIIKLNNSINRFEKYYIIDEDHRQDLKDLSNDLDTLSKFKRRIEVFISGASSEETYYTDLLNKINDLKTGVHDLNEDYLTFKNYLDSLKVDVDESYELINTRYLQAKKAESILREFNNDEVTSRYSEGIERTYNLIDALNSTIRSLPIDVNRINELKTQLDYISKDVLGKIDESASYRHITIDNIMLINRDRMKFSDVNNLLSQAENLFFNGEYRSSYEMTETILNRINDKDKLEK